MWRGLLNIFGIDLGERAFFEPKTKKRRGRRDDK